MANHTFCIKCGFKNIFESSPSKFCGGCGLALNRADNSFKPAPESRSSSQKNKRKSIFAEPYEEEEDEEDFSDLQLDKTSLAKDWEVVAPPQSNYQTTFEDLAIRGAKPRSERYTRPEFKVEGDVVKASYRECSRVRTSRDVTNDK